MVTIAPIKMVMTGGWFIILLYLHHIITCFCIDDFQTPRSPMCPMPSNLLQGKSDTQDIRSSRNRGPRFSRSGAIFLRKNGVNLPAPTIVSHELLMFRWIWPNNTLIPVNQRRYGKSGKFDVYSLWYSPNVLNQYHLILNISNVWPYYLVIFIS